MDEEGFPCIPASSWKGAIRAIVQADDSDVAKEIAQWYEEIVGRQKNRKPKSGLKSYVRKKDKEIIKKRRNGLKSVILRQ